MHILSLADNAARCLHAMSYCDDRERSPAVFADTRAGTGMWAGAAALAPHRDGRARPGKGRLGWFPWLSLSRRHDVRGNGALTIEPPHRAALVARAGLIEGRKKHHAGDKGRRGRL